MTTSAAPDTDADLKKLDPEQLPVPKHRQHGAGHFAGLYSAEHVAATEFVFGATFVALGASIWDILIGLLIGNALAVLSFWLVTAPIAVQARLSLYTYLQKIAGDSFSRVYNLANAVIFAIISAAMITVAATAIRRIVNVPAQSEPYPTSIVFVAICVTFSVVAVIVAIYGFNILAKIASIVGPWLMLMFTVGGMVLLPYLTESITGSTQLSSFSEFVDVAGATVFTGINAAGEPGIGMLEVAGFAWAANTFSHFGLIDMALLRYARKASYGLTTATGMMFGHYVAWISAGLMGAATATISVTAIEVLDPGDVAWYALGYAGFICVIIAGWTTANPNLYRAGLAAQAFLPKLSRTKATLIVGVVVVVASCFPFVFRNMLPLLTYAGLILAPVGGIVFAEHHIFKRLGYTRFWMRFSGAKHNIPAFIAWPVALAFAIGLNLLDVIPYYYLFVPAWIVAIVVYTFVAGRMGAGKEYPEAQAEEDAYQERVRKFHEKQAKVEDVSSYKDTTVLTRITWWAAVACLVVIFVFGWRVLFNSPDLYNYYVNRDQFYSVTLWLSLVYFALALFTQQRSARVIKALSEASGQSRAPGDSSVVSVRGATSRRKDSEVDDGP